MVRIIRMAPALAGGPLRNLNRLLLGLAHARREGGKGLRLLLDDGLLGDRDRRVGVLNQRGDVVFLPGPENGLFDLHSREAFAAALVDTMPPTSEAFPVVDRLLPQPELRPLDAARVLWTELLGPSGLDVEVFSGKKCPPADGNHPAQSVTWFGARHLAALRGFGVAPRVALGGQERLARAMMSSEGCGVLAEGEALATACEEGLARLGEIVKEEEPRAFGAWHRLRREIRRANGVFRRRIERSQRNRRGIRGARLRALSQGLRPLDGEQGEHLGMIAAAALFQLDLDRLDEAVTLLESALDQADILVDAGALRLLD